MRSQPLRFGQCLAQDGVGVVTFAISIAAVDATWLRIALAALGVALVGFLAWLPTTAGGGESP